MWVFLIMPKIISLVNQKAEWANYHGRESGGVFGRFRQICPLVDIDPQANATSGLGIDHRKLEKGIYNTLLGEASLRDIVCNTNHEGYRLAPASLGLAGANIELVNMPNREFKLREILEEAKHAYEYILIDCPPSLGLLTVNGLVAADTVLIPVQAEYYALEGLGQLLETISLVKKICGRI